MKCVFEPVVVEAVMIFDKKLIATNFVSFQMHSVFDGTDIPVLQKQQ